MTPSIRDARAVIQKRISELREQLHTLTSALAVLAGKRTNANAAPNTNRSHQPQFDAMMEILSARKGTPITPVELREAIKAKGKWTSGDESTTLYAQLAKAVDRGLAVKRAGKYLASPTIRKITQKAAPKPHAARGRMKANGHSRKLNPELYAATIDIVRESGEVTAGGIRAALSRRQLPTTAMKGHLEKGMREKVIMKKGSGPDAQFRPVENGTA